MHPIVGTDITIKESWLFGSLLNKYYKYIIIRFQSKKIKIF